MNTQRRPVKLAQNNSENLHCVSYVGLGTNVYGIIETESGLLFYVPIERIQFTDTQQYKGNQVKDIEKVKMLDTIKAFVEAWDCNRTSMVSRVNDLRKFVEGE